ncbi:hypothetical protein DFAR_2310011 [Desulfarculales bacterium]
MPWTREGSRFTLLFEQAAMTLVQEMPMLAAARIIGASDTRLWRVVQFYVAQTLSKMDLGRVKAVAVALDETASKKDRNYVTIFVLRRPRPQAKAVHLRYPRHGQGFSSPAPPLPA